MSRIRRRGLTAVPARCFALLLCFLVSSSHAQVKQLTFAAIANSVNAHISMEVVSEAYARLGIAVDSDFLPAGRSLLMAEFGQYDGELFRIDGISRDYPHLIKVPTPINQLQVMAFCRTADKHLIRLAELSRYRLGVRQGIRFNSQLPLTESTQRVAANHQLFSMLQQFRIDVALVARANGLELIRNMQLQDISSCHQPLLSLQLYHYVHVRHRQLIPQLDRIFKDMAFNGRMTAIREAYLNKLAAKSAPHTVAEN